MLSSECDERYISVHGGREGGREGRKEEEEEEEDDVMVHLEACRYLIESNSSKFTITMT
jgi:hypothetical protein